MEDIKTRAKDKQINIRLSIDTFKKLEYLCKVNKRNKTQLIEALIDKDYLATSKIGQEKLEEMQKQIDQLTKLFSENFGGE